MSVFARGNLLAWCIVPFDARKRGPQERAAMLQRLGIGALAYDWRDQHIERFDEELCQLRDHGVEMTAFWLSGSYQQDERGVWEDPHLLAALEFVERNDLKIEMWKMLVGGDLQQIADVNARYDAAAAQAEVLATIFNERGCTYGMYNHGSWGGEPATMVEVVKRVEVDNVGIVYNFFHGHDQLDLMPDAFRAMRPYLMSVNLNGMTPEGPKILPLGTGERDREILQMIADSGYDGPIGLIDHRPEIDAEVSLRENLAGMQKILAEIGDQHALAMYP